VPQLEIVPFSRDLLLRYFAQQPPVRPSVEYLAGYLDELKVKSVLVEDHYVDRHYLDDFASYYSRSFRAPTGPCSRLHFFEMEAGELETEVAAAFAESGKLAEIEGRLIERYVGFVVRRPLLGAAIGRTVLRTYPADARRHYEVLRPYRVDICGLHLRVNGLAYQEQDVGAAVCASTALWSALQRVAHVAGHRTPTPSAITRAANSPFPASDGLHELQMASALSCLGYSADRFVPAENRALFRAKVVSCLESHLPVVFLMYRTMTTGAGEIPVGHAVTLTGFTEPPSVVQVPSTQQNLPPLPMKSGSLDVVYVHDDNLGSHAHYEIFDSDDEMPEGYKALKLRRGRSDRDVPWWTKDEWTISSALVPKPEKLRLPVTSLFSNIYAMWPLLSICFPGIATFFGARFALGVEYRRELLQGGRLEPARMRQFQQALRLPRHVGVLSTYHADQHLADVVIDVSEVQRNAFLPTVLAIVAPGLPANSPAAVNLQQLATSASVPILTGP
jgi:hypothetical protein